MHATLPSLAEPDRPSRSPACRVFLTAVGMLVCLGIGPVRAASIAWPEAPYRYLVVDQDLRAVLEEFGKNLGVRVALADSVKGRVRGNLPEGSPQSFLDALTKAYGLEWYFDGAVLSISTVAEAGTRFLDLHEVPFARALDGVQSAGLTDPRFVLRPGPAPNLAMVSGPPRYVQLISEAVAAMAAQKPTVPPVQVVAQAAGVVRVFRGSASAGSTH